MRSHARPTAIHRLALALALLAPVCRASEGIGPSFTHTAGSAFLDGAVAVLTDGVPRQAGAISRTTPVSTIGAWSFACRFRFGVAPGGTRRNGFAFLIHNGAGFAPGWVKYTDDNASTAAALGSQITGQVGLYFRCDGDASYAGYHEGHHDGPADPEPASDGGVIAADFASDHVFAVAAKRTPPTTADGDDGTLTFSITDESERRTWTRTYTGLRRMETIFRLAQGAPPDESVTEVGDRAYATFIAVNGDGANRIEILDWSLAPDGVADAPAHATSTWTAPAGERLRVTASLVSASGGLLRTLCQALTVVGGRRYAFTSDGRDVRGRPLPPGYRFRVVVDRSSHVGNLIGNNLGDPTDGYTLLTGIGITGVGAAADGSSVVATGVGGDTVAQSGLYPLDPRRGSILADDVRLIAPYAQWCNGIAIDDGDLGFSYAIGNDDAGKYWLIRSKKRTWPAEALYRFSCTGPVGTANPDGSVIVERDFGAPIRVLMLEDQVRAQQPADQRYERVARLAVSADKILVAYRYAGRVGVYDKASFVQSGPAIAVPCPRAVAVLGNGNYAVAHGAAEGDAAATVITVFDARTHARIRVMSEITGLGDVVGMSCAGGRLAIADDGPGRKRVTIHAITSDTARGKAERTLGSAASFGDDDGVHKTWHLLDCAIDAQGAVYVAKQPPCAGNRGGQIVAYAPDGTVRWQKYATAYIATAVAGPRSDPTFVVGSNWACYAIDPATGTDTYRGSGLPRGQVAFGGVPHNPWSSTGSAAACAPPRWATIAGKEFLGMPGAAAAFLSIYRRDAPVSFHCAAVVFTSKPGDGRRGSWHDAGGTGLPRSEEIRFHGEAAGNAGAGHPQLAADGAIWYLDGTSVARLPCAGLSAQGDPMYDWAKAEIVASAGTSYETRHALAVVPSPQGPYVISDDLSIAPNTSSHFVPGCTQGGSRTLVALDPAGGVRWVMPLPEFTQSLDAVDGWVLVGGMSSSRFWLYRADGQLVIEIPPATRDDYLDFRYGAMTLSALPDGRLVILAESIAKSGQVIAVVDPRKAPTTAQATAVPGGSVPVR
ncbi:MAG TPA: hypothetical protein VEL07_07405 [Planctomycetota bacterium]|nr:hypothetical protein [Planctomycetota bacterium]